MGRRASPRAAAAFLLAGASLCLRPAAAAAASPPPSPAAADACAADLDRFEAALRGAPDRLVLGSDYRHRVIACETYDRAIDFFAALTEAHPTSAAAMLNYGYAHVDKIPAAGAVTRVLLANTAVSAFSRALEIEPSWLALFTRGNSYLYWPRIFGRAPLGVADLEKAAELGRKEGNRPFHVRAWIALGDGYWKVDELAKARATWSEGLRLFPGEARLVARLAREGEELAALIEADLDPQKRVDTDLTPMGSSP